MLWKYLRHKQYKMILLICNSIKYKVIFLNYVIQGYSEGDGFQE